MALPTLAIGSLVALAGVGLSIYGWRRRRYHRAIVGTPTRDVRQVDRPGPVELVGEVVAADDSFDAPLSGADETVVAGWSVEEWSETGDHSRWTTVADGVDAVPFLLDDGTDRIRVDPGSHASRGGLLGRVTDLGDLADSVSAGPLTVDFERLPTVRRVGAEDPTPERVRRFVAHESTVDRQTGSLTNLIDVGNAHGDRRYAEGTIRVGDEVYLLGPVRPAHGDGRVDGDGNRDVDRRARLRPGDAVVRPAPDGEVPFLLSERSEDRLVASTRVWRYALGAGLLAVAVGLATMLPGVPP